MEQLRAFVAKQDMSRMHAFLSIFLLRFDSDKRDLTQTSLRYLDQKIAGGASAFDAFYTYAKYHIVAHFEELSQLPVELVKLLTLLKNPKLDSLIVTGRCEHAAVWSPGNTVDVHLMTFLLCRQALPF